MSQMPWIPVPVRTVIEKEIDGEFLLHDPLTGSVHHLNAVAGLVWRLCDGVRSSETIAAEVGAAYRKSPSEIAVDIEDVLRNFSEKGLIGQL